MKSLKVQLEQLRKAQKAKEIEEEGTKGKTEVRGKEVCLLHLTHSSQDPFTQMIF